MNPIVKEFQDDTQLISEVQTLSAQGVDKDNLYVISHDSDRTARVAGKIDANKVGIKEEGLSEAVGNIFRKKGDELRAKFKELGFLQDEVSELEEKLDHGKILLINTNPVK